MEGLFWPSTGKWGTTEAVQTGTWEDLEAVRWRDWRSIKNCKQRELAEKMAGTSLVVQRIRIHLWMQGTRVQSLVREDFTCHGATRPLHRNYWARALEVRSYSYGNPQPWSLCSPTREAAAMCTTSREAAPARYYRRSAENKEDPVLNTNNSKRKDGSTTGERGGGPNWRGCGDRDAGLKGSPGIRVEKCY